MYTDTKNLANATSISEELSHMKPDATKSRNRFRSLWRLITLRKDAKRRSGGGSSSGIHPNNINLNNNAQIHSYQQQELQQQQQSHAKDTVHELSKSQLEDYIASLRKMVPELIVDCGPTKDSFLDTSDTLKVISSASIEKSTHSHVNCVYGRNCQHNHAAPVIELPPASDHLDQLPVHYLHTDDGTFFWTLTEERTDDDLLNSWLCNTRQQFPTQAAQYC